MSVCPVVQNVSVLEQEKVDQLMLDMDGTENKCRLLPFVGMWNFSIELRVYSEGSAFQCTRLQCKYRHVMLPSVVTMQTKRTAVNLNTAHINNLKKGRNGLFYGLFVFCSPLS